MPEQPQEQPQDEAPDAAPHVEGAQPHHSGEGVPIRPEDRRGVMGGGTGGRPPNLLAGEPRQDEPDVVDRIVRRPSRGHDGEDNGNDYRDGDGGGARAIVRQPPNATQESSQRSARPSSRHASQPKGEKVMSLGDHLDELRTRVIHALCGIAALFFGSLYFGPTVLNWMIKPVQNALRSEGLPATMLATGMFETFFTYLKISTVASIALGFPWILWQLWKFVAPGLYRHERRFVTMLLPMSLVLTIASSLFLYFVVLPIMLHFFVYFGTTVSPTEAAVAPPPAGVSPLNVPVLAADPPAPKGGDVWFNSELKELRLALVMPNAAADTMPVIYSAPLSRSSGIVLQPKIREWVDTLLGLALAFAAGFQLPVVVLLLGWVGVVTPAFLTTYRLHALFAIAVIAALITPPDPITMLIMMAPLYLLYEASIWMLRVFPASRVAGDMDDGREPDGEPSEG